MIKGEKIFYSVFIEMQMCGPRQGSRTLPWAKFQIFLEALFICNNFITNLNENFHTYWSRYFFFFFFFQISARSSLKKFENEKWPKVGYLPLSHLVCCGHATEAQKSKRLVRGINALREKILYKFYLQFRLWIFVKVLSVYFKDFHPCCQDYKVDANFPRDSLKQSSI